MKPNDDGWIEWAGGENPAPGKRVNVKFRDGKISDDKEKSELWIWDHADLKSDIIAYRVVG